MSAGEAAAAPFRVRPRVDDTNRHFWTGGERGELVFLRCGDCGHYIHPPGPVCPECLSRNIAPQAVSGQARVHSFTVNEQSWNPTMPAPYLIALVEIVEQPSVRLMTNLVNVDPPDVAFGMPVHAIFEQHDDVWIPLFTPDAS